MKINYFCSRKSKTKDKAAVDETEENKSDITEQPILYMLLEGELIKLDEWKSILLETVQSRHLLTISHLVPEL